MSAVYQTLALPLVPTACPRVPTSSSAEPTATLDDGPYPAALGPPVTITGPAQPCARIGASIFDSANLIEESCGEILPIQQARLRRPATPPALARTGSIRTLNPAVLPLYMPDHCSVNTSMVSAAATYHVPPFYAAAAWYPEQMTAQKGAAPRYMPVFPATIGSQMTAYLLTGRLVHVDREQEQAVGGGAKMAVTGAADDTVEP